MLQQTADILKALGEPTRLKIIKFLSIQELCICELVAILDMSQPRVSQHMKVLRQVGLVRERKVAQKSYFSLNKVALDGTFIESFKSFMQTGLDEITELAAENQRFAELDSNEEVQSCKNGCRTTEIKKIS